MPPIALNRRRFLGCSAAAGLALVAGQGRRGGRSTPLAGPARGDRPRDSRDDPACGPCSSCPASRSSPSATPSRSTGSAGRESSRRRPAQRPEAFRASRRLLERGDVDAVVVAFPATSTPRSTSTRSCAGKHLYAEKPLAPDARRSAIADRRGRQGSPGPVVHVGFQRRSNPRFREGVELIRPRRARRPWSRATAAWISSNGPMNGHGGWLARRDRSGDWMVEQAVHVWDVFHWLAGGPPARAFGQGRRPFSPYTKKLSPACLAENRPILFLISVVCGFFFFHLRYRELTVKQKLNPN